MEITLKDKWHESWDKGDYEVFGADIEPEGKKEERIFIDYDTDFIHRNKETGELSLPHMFPDGSLGFLPLKGFETGENKGMYSVDMDKLKDSYPDFRMKIHISPDGKEFMADAIKFMASPLKEELGKNSADTSDSIQYELTGRDVFDFLEVEMRTELEIEHLAETNPVSYAELSHSSRTSKPQFRCIEFSDFKNQRGELCSFSSNPSQLSIISKLMHADEAFPKSIPLHITSLIAKNLAFNNVRNKSFEDSLELFNNMFSGDPIKAVSYAAYHSSTATEYGDFYVNAIDVIGKGLDYLAKMGHGYDEISRMVHSKSNLFRDDSSFMAVARTYMRTPAFMKLCEASVQKKNESSLNVGIQRSR